MNTFFEEMVNQGHTPKNKYGQTASTTVTSIVERQGSIPAEITSLKITNTSSATNISLSVDGGSNFKIVLPLSTINIPVSAHEIQIKTLASTATYELDYTVRP